jgi:hypothetical protein
MEGVKMNKKILLDCLEKVSPGLSRKELIEQATSFAFMGDKVVTFNDEISISHKLTGINLTGAVKAEELYRFLVKVKTEEIELTIVENEIRIKSGKAKVGLTIESEIKLPLSELGEITKWSKLPDDFLHSLEIVRFCCSKDMSRPILTCVNVRKDGMMEACDNYRAIRFQMKSKCPLTFLLPASSANILIGYQVSMIAASPGWVHFTDKEKELVFSCRIYSEEYNNLDANFVVKDAIPFTFPKESLNILDRAQIFSKGDIFIDQQVQVAVEGKRLFFRVKKAGSWFEEWIKVTDIPPFVTSVHPQFLQDILKLNSTCEITPGRMIKFIGTNWEHIASMSVSL